MTTGNLSKDAHYTARHFSSDRFSLSRRLGGDTPERGSNFPLSEERKGPSTESHIGFEGQSVSQSHPTAETLMERVAAGATALCIRVIDREALLLDGVLEVDC